ncbi:PadR family transcriptional regulator [Ferroplasma sp.]|uniref:PadR family transcriptional regulator n=1 Tax=Ferroplasma sp. TaxID=2591003 RepID=UPI00307EC5E0
MNDYSLRILYILNLQKMTGYGLSKRLYNSNTGKNISNGALIPVLNKLMADGFIDFTIINGKKYYKLTPDGKKFVNNILDLNEEVKDQAIFDAIDREFPYINVFTDPNDYIILKDLIKQIGHPIIELIRQGFYMKKRNDSANIEALERKISDLLEEAKAINLDADKNNG